MENWVSPVSLQQQGHWAFATLLCSRRSRNPSWNLPWEITSVLCRGTGVSGLGASACQMHGSQVFRLDCCMSPEVDVTSSSFPVPDSVRGTQLWGTLLCNHEPSGGFLYEVFGTQTSDSHRKSCLVCALHWHVWINAAPYFSTGWWKVNRARILRAFSALLSASQGYEAGWWTPVPFYWSMSERHNWS